MTNLCKHVSNYISSLTIILTESDAENAANLDLVASQTLGDVSSLSLANSSREDLVALGVDDWTGFLAVFGP